MCRELPDVVAVIIGNLGMYLSGQLLIPIYCLETLVALHGIDRDTVR